jgi:hypothetical protein
MLRPTLTLTVALVAALAGCADNFDEDLKAVQDAPYLSTGGTTGMASDDWPRHQRGRDHRCERQRR